jgi:hypothetical protein
MCSEVFIRDYSYFLKVAGSQRSHMKLTRVYYKRRLAFLGCIELHALASWTKSPNWWKGLDNLFQHSPYVFALWPIVTCFGEPQYIYFNFCVGQDLILGPPALIPYWIACTSQLNQKSELMERARQFISTVRWLRRTSAMVLFLSTR